jgi:hypothetical protein
MQTQNIDAKKFIVAASPGMSIYGRNKLDGGDWETSFFIQEEKAYINKLGKSPIIHIRAGCLIYSGIPLVVVMFLVNNDPDMLYEVWFNYCQSGDGKKYFEDLTSQERIVLHWYCGNKRIRSIKINNNLQDGFKTFMTEIVKYPKWDMNAFDQARGLVYQDYPTPIILWNKLSDTDFSIFN